LHQRNRVRDFRLARAERLRDLEAAGGEIAGLVEQADDVAGDGGEPDVVGRRPDLREQVLGQGFAGRPQSPESPGRSSPAPVSRSSSPGLSSASTGRSSAPRPSPRSWSTGERSRLVRRASSGISEIAGMSGGPSSALARSSSGLASSASPIQVSISRFDSVSSLIACCNCGVITSDWPNATLGLRSRRGPSAILCAR
jgi:hypothetical protein